jgi:hypothetical protein
MKSGDYASEISGVRRLRRRELAPVATTWDYIVTEQFDVDSARSVFVELPEACEVCFFDPERPKEEVYLFSRRVGKALVRRRGGHGWMSGAEEETIDRAAAWLMASHFVQKPHPDFEAFSVSLPR